MVLQWGATDRGLVDALAGSESTSKSGARRGTDFLALLGDLLRAAQKAGTVRKRCRRADVKAIMVGTAGDAGLSARRRGRAADGGRAGRVARRVNDLALALVEC